MRIRLLATCLLPLLLCSCVGTSLKETWKSPDYHKSHAGKIATVAVDDRGELRRGFENRFVSQLKKHQTAAMVTYDLLSLPEIKADKVAAAERFRLAGADTVLVIRLVDTGTSYSESRRGGASWNPLDSWYDYYSLAFVDMTTTYGSYKQTARLETSIFDLKTEKRIWSALTDTVTTDTMDRIAEMDKIVTKVIAAMEKDRMIP
jgi:hypothetical protein